MIYAVVYLATLVGVATYVAVFTCGRLFAAPFALLAAAAVVAIIFH